jgi:hypothetical protein
MFELASFDHLQGMDIPALMLPPGEPGGHPIHRQILANDGRGFQWVLMRQP